MNNNFLESSFEDICDWLNINYSDMINFLNEEEIDKETNYNIFDNLSKRRITDIYYYYWDFSFKKRIRDKVYLKSNKLLDFIPIKWVFQYKMRGWNEEYFSKYLEWLNLEEDLFFIWKRFRELYRDDSMNSKFKCSNLLFKNLSLKNLSCSYIVYWLIDNKLVKIIFPISIYIELNCSFDLSKIIKSKNRITIEGDILKNKSVFKYFESNYVEDKFLFEVDRVINRFNISIENREYSLLNQ